LFKRINARFEPDAVHDIEYEMIRISNSPNLILRMPFGKHRCQTEIVFDDHVVFSSYLLIGPSI